MERRACEYGLLYTDRPPYEVLSTKWLSYGDLCCLKQVEEMVEIYYNSGQFANTLEFLCPYFESPYDMYENLGAWYEEHGLFGIQSSRIRKYEILLEFASARISRNGQATLILPSICSGRTETQEQNVTAEPLSTDKQLSLLREYLLYDLYLREQMKSRPSFAPSQEPWKEAIHHILHKEAGEHVLFPELADCNYRELTRALHVEVFTAVFDAPCVILFCYRQRDPLTNNGITAKVSLADLL